MASPKSVDKTHLSRKNLALDELYQRKLNRSVRHVIETRPPTLKSNRFTSGFGSPTGQTFFGTLETRDGSALERRNGATLVWCRKSCRIVFLFRCIFHPPCLPSFSCRCPPEFVLLFREFGGSLCVRDSHGRMATGEHAECRQVPKSAHGNPEMKWSRGIIPQT